MAISSMRSYVKNISINYIRNTLHLSEDSSLHVLRVVALMRIKTDLTSLSSTKTLFTLVLQGNVISTKFHFIRLSRLLERVKDCAMEIYSIMVENLI